jgi:hypothetical protein
VIKKDLDEVEKAHDVHDEVSNNSGSLDNKQLSLASLKFSSTHPRAIEERRYHESYENHTQTVQKDQQKHREVVGELKHAEREEENDRHERQECHEETVDDEPRQPENRVS